MKANLEIVDFFDALLGARADIEGTREVELLEENKHKMVSLSQVGYLLLEVLDSVGEGTREYVQEEIKTSQELMEARLVAVVESLEEGPREKIVELFHGVGDDLLEHLNKNTETAEPSQGEEDNE